MVQEVLQGAVVKTQEEAIDTQIAIYFDIIQEHSVSLTSQITDNWIENNTVISDHIANDPTVITLRGLTGEVVYVPNDEEKQKLLEQAKRTTTQTMVQKLSKLSILFPPVDNLTQFAINIRDYAEASANRYVGIVKQFRNSNNPQLLNSSNNTYSTKIKIIYNKLEKIRQKRFALTVETPYRVFENMYIQSLTFRQGNENYITDIELSLKQVYFTDTLTTKADEKVLAKYNQFQRKQVENHGKVQGHHKSLSAQIFDGDKINLLGN